MSLKKTWFSDVLWFLFAVPSAFVSYCVLTVVLQSFYAMLSSCAPGYEFYMDLGAKLVTMLLVVLAVVLIRFICSRVRKFSIPRWLGILGHAFLAAGIIAGFCLFRYAAFNYAYYLQSYSRAPSEQAMLFYELSKVAAVTDSSVGIGTLSVLEQAYICVIRTLFMFFGNKVEVILLAQLALQSLTFILLIIIGWTLQKGIFAWIPALLYAVAPTFYYTASDAGITNLWTFIVALGLFVICLLEKIWKKKNITYLVMVFAQLLVVGFVYFAKRSVLIYAGTPFVSGGTTPGVAGILDIEMLILAALMITYCVSYFMDKQDHHSLFVLPFVGFGFFAVWLSNYEYEISYCMMNLAMITLFFMIPQSMRVVFRTKPDIVTGKNKADDNAKAPEAEDDSDIPVNQEEEMEPAKFEWDEMKEVMHSTEGIEVRKEEPVKVELSLSEVLIDRKAPIENVLPMPKKHKPKVLDYAFEPIEDMMHYDVEIENDEYDY